MTSPSSVAAFHRDFDRHPDDRVRFFAAVRDLVPATATVLYPGSYVDIGPSIWFDRVTYVDIDKRAARFFAETDQVRSLIATKRRAAGTADGGEPSVIFHHLDYRADLPVEDHSIDVLVSLYAGFISEYCTRYLKPGGLLVTNNSHGDASMATLDPDYELVATIESGNGQYRTRTTNLENRLRPKRGHPPTVEELHSTNRGIAYTRPAFAYAFRHHRPEARAGGPSERS